MRRFGLIASIALLSAALLSACGPAADSSLPPTAVPVLRPTVALQAKPNIQPTANQPAIAPEPSPTPSIYDQLADIDYSQPLPASAADVYQTEVETIFAGCLNADQEQVGEYALQTWNSLDTSYRPGQMFDMLMAVEDVERSTDGTVDCKDIFAQYAAKVSTPL